MECSVGPAERTGPATLPLHLACAGGGGVGASHTTTWIARAASLGGVTALYPRAAVRCHSRPHQLEGPGRHVDIRLHLPNLQRQSERGSSKSGEGSWPGMGSLGAAAAAAEAPSAAPAPARQPSSYRAGLPNAVQHRPCTCRLPAHLLVRVLQPLPAILHHVPHALGVPAGHASKHSSQAAGADLR